MRRTSKGLCRWSLLFSLALTGCHDNEDVRPQTYPVFNLSADLSTPEQFFDFPYPSDLRLNAQQGPDFRGFPNPEANLFVDNILTIAADRPKFPLTPVAYFRFEGNFGGVELSAAASMADESPVFLIDVDETSPDRGKRTPVVTSLLPEDAYVPSNLFAVAPRPGFVLTPERRYAFVLTSQLRDADGLPIGTPEGMESLRSGSGADPAANDLYAPLWSTLSEVGFEAKRVIAATVFTTGDVVTAMGSLSDRIRERYDVTIENLAVDPDDGATHERFCELHGTVSFPQFQTGTPPFPTEGLFQFDDDGELIEQRQEVAPVVITLPNKAMPAGGYPLVMYFHGSGGRSTQVVDRGTVTEIDGSPTKGEGPAHVLAAHDFGTVGCAHPVNPERVPGADDLAYLNFDNLKAFRDTFRQGIMEQRLYLDALLTLEISPELVTSCTGLSLPDGETAYRFASKPVLAMGQSMGGMYTNTIAAVEPRIEAVVPTGAGGYWSYFILETSLVGGKTLVPIILGSTPELSFLHPGLSLLQHAWEHVEPMVYMPRLARQPLDNHPVRPVYEPVGKDDSYFPMVLFDAIALAYRHRQAGESVWPEMQEALSLADLGGFDTYPVVDNLSSLNGASYTGSVVQYEGDGIYDPHAIFAQLDAVKHQYGCFFETFLKSGKAKVVAPAELGSACE